MPSTVMAVLEAPADGVMIAVDPLKASWTAVAVDGRYQPLATIQVDGSGYGYPPLAST